MKEVQQILNSICGVDENDEAKCIIGINLVSINEQGEEIKRFDTESIYKPIVSLYPNNALVQMDIDYRTESDVSLQKICNILDKYRQMSSDKILSDENLNDTLALTITLIPASGEIDHYIVATNPLLHCLTALGPKKPTSCLRLLFTADDIHFFNSDPIDTKSLDVEIDDEIRRRELADQNAQSNREKRIEQMQHLEELRRKGN